MKKHLLILAILALVSSCDWIKSRSAKTDETQETMEQSPQDSLSGEPVAVHVFYDSPYNMNTVYLESSKFASGIRLNEELKFGNHYTNVFEYLGTIDWGNSRVVYAKKDGSVFPFITYKQSKDWVSGRLFKITWMADVEHVEYFDENTPMLRYDLIDATEEREQGAVVNGIRWATRNVDAPGKFTAEPDDTGMFYQWNRKKGWQGKSVANWDTTRAKGSTWADANSPCPEGWRLPRKSELESLLDTVNVDREDILTYRQGGGRVILMGVQFIDRNSGNKIFLPTEGSINIYGEFVVEEREEDGKHGSYWSSVGNSWTEEEDSAHFLFVGGFNETMNFHGRASGMSVRCVAR